MPPDADRLRRLSEHADRANAVAAAVGRAMRAIPDTLGPWRLTLAGEAGVAAAGGRRLVLADVAGYGGPAGLLVGLLARDAALAAGGSPGDAIAAANRAVLGLGLPEPAFVTMLVADFDDAVAFARAAAPAPTYRPLDGPEQVWAVPGPLVGVFAAEYPTRTEPTRLGDAIVFAVGGLTVTAERPA